MEKMLKFGVFFTGMTSMADMIRGFADQLRLGLGPLQGLDSNTNGSPISSIVIAGMGGSAFGGEVVKNYLGKNCPVPFLINRDYSLPGFIGTGTLLIVSSYSGDTEETLSALETVAEKFPRVVCISSGGKLEKIAKEKGYAFLSIPGGLPPRKAAGYSISRQLQTLRHFGLIPDYSSDLQEAIELVAGFEDHALSRKIADALSGKMPMIYASSEMESTAIRLRQQIEENAKQLASHHVVPEMNHNELVGWALPEKLLRQCSAVFLRSSYDHPRVKLRMDFSTELISKKASAVLNIEAKGNSKLAQIMYLLHLGDWASLYLAELNGVDPVPVQVISTLKSQLGKQ